MNAASETMQTDPDRAISLLKKACFNAKLLDSLPKSREALSVMR